MNRGRRERVVRAAIGLLVPMVITAGLMVVAPPGTYLWFKAFHVAAAVTWVAGMLGLTYLLSWHARVTDPETGNLLSRMESQVLHGIVNPAMVLAWGIGLWLAWDAGWYASGWFQAKLILVVALSALHGWVVGAIRGFAREESRPKRMTYGDVTVVGALVALGVIVLAVVKPM